MRDDTLITALETRPEKGLTFIMVQHNVIAEYERRLHILNDSVLKESCDKMKHNLFFRKKSGIRIGIESTINHGCSVSISEERSIVSHIR